MPADRYRTGLGDFARTIFNEDEILIGVMDTPYLGQLVVAALNAYGSGDCGCHTNEPCAEHDDPQTVKVTHLTPADLAILGPPAVTRDQVLQAVGAGFTTAYGPDQDTSATTVGHIADAVMALLGEGGER